MSDTSPLPPRPLPLPPCPLPPRPPRRRTSTASLRDQCSVPDLNCESARSVFRAGPQLRASEISVPCRTSTAIL